MNPEIALSLCEQAFDLIQKGNSKAAADIFKKAVEINPKSTYALSGLGWPLFQQGLNDDVEE